MKNFNLLIFSLIVLGLTACTNEPDPEPATDPNCQITPNLTLKSTSDYCNNSNGTIIIFSDIDVTHYSIDNGETYEASNVFNDLSEGTYYVKVKNQDGCVSSTNDSVIVTSATESFTFTGETTDAGCGSSNGSITIKASGSGGYTYSFQGSDPGPDSVYTNLSQGSYFIKVYDSTGCSSSKSVVVNAGDVSYTTDVDPILISTCATTDCHDGSNSHVDLTIYSNVKTWASGIKSRLNNGSMPKTGTISAADKQTIICWIDDGAPNN